MGFHMSFAKRLSAQFALSAALAAAPAFSTPPSALAVALVPPGAVPDFMDQFYGLARKSLLSQRPKNAEARVAEPLQTYIDPPAHPFLKQVMSAPPAQAEAIVRKCGPSLCAQKFNTLSARDQIIAQLFLTQTLFHNGLSDRDLSIYSDVIGRIDPDRDFARLADEKLVRIVTDMMADADLIDDLKKWVPIDKISARNAREQYYLRQSTMQRLNNIIRDAYGLPYLRVIVDSVPRDLRFAGVHVDPRLEDNTIFRDVSAEPFIIMNYAGNVMDTIAQAMFVLYHEAKHGVDFDLLHKMRTGGMGSDDPMFIHTAIVAMNTNKYLDSCIVDDPSRTDCARDFQNYESQYLERNANQFVHCASAAQKYLLGGGAAAAGRAFTCTPPVTPQ